jgi:hypothetical protein
MNFYSYLWLREDGTPYYAGKGCGRRAYESDSHNVHRPKLRLNILVFPMLSEAEAFESEIAFIDLFGRLDLGTGCLRNITAGGDGVFGRRHTAECRQRMSVSHTGHKHSDQTKQKIRNASLLQRHSDETKRKLSELRTGVPNLKLRGYKHSEETKKKISLAKTGKPGHPAWNLGISPSPEVKRKIAEHRIGYKHSEETKRKIGEKRRGWTHSEETKQKCREAAIAQGARKRENDAKLQRCQLSKHDDDPSGNF